MTRVFLLGFITEDTEFTEKKVLSSSVCLVSSVSKIAVDYREPLKTQIFVSSARRMVFENRSVQGVHEDHRKSSNAAIGQKDGF
jgi:hypothetical protein